MAGPENITPIHSSQSSRSDQFEKYMFFFGESGSDDPPSPGEGDGDDADLWIWWGLPKNIADRMYGPAKGKSRPAAEPAAEGADENGDGSESKFVTVIPTPHYVLNYSQMPVRAVRTGWDDARDAWRARSGDKLVESWQIQAAGAMAVVGIIITLFPPAAPALAFAL